MFKTIDELFYIVRDFFVEFLANNFESENQMSQ